METCKDHLKITVALDNIAETVSRLEASQQSTAEVQAEMATSLAVMASTLEKIENTNVVIERLAGKLDSIFVTFSKMEKAHDELFERLRVLENLGCGARIKKVETRQEKQLWGLITAVGVAVLGILGKLILGIK